MVLPQLPQDPSSGAARSVTTICEILAAAGFQVHALATTATEKGDRLDVRPWLESSGRAVQLTRSRGERPELHFRQRGVSYRLLDTGGAGAHGWNKVHGARFDQLFDEELERHDPDLVLTYGGTPADLKRRQRARRRGIKVVFALRNFGYLVPGAFEHTDAILAASEFVSRRYRDVLGVESTALPLPLAMEDVVAPEREAVFVTMINPSPEKGVMFFARLAEEISLRRPTIAILAVESRGGGGTTVRAGMAGGFDLRRHENIMLAEAVSKPREIFAATRILLAPSLWEEPAGRVAAEAMVNGVPALVSARGGLAEVANGGAVVLPIPQEVTPGTTVPPPAWMVEPWVEAVLKFAADDDYYQQASARAYEAGRIYRPDELHPRYVEFFLKVLSS